MQIILLESIPHVGQLGDVVKVKDGFARNYLIPTKKAKRATAAAIEEFKAHKAELERAQAERLAKAEELKGKIDGLTITIASKAGVELPMMGRGGNRRRGNGGADTQAAANAEWQKVFEQLKAKFPTEFAEIEKLLETDSAAALKKLQALAAKA